MDSTAALATAVRDQPATGVGDGGVQWNMSDLATSAIALDDVTPLYRAQLFSMMDHPIPAANVDNIQAELARRADFGATFDAGYLHRDTVCLDCHNSQTSVTDSDGKPFVSRSARIGSKASWRMYAITIFMRVTSRSMLRAGRPDAHRTRPLRTGQERCRYRVRRR